MWKLREWQASVAEFHNADLLTEPSRTVWYLEVKSSAIALGSSQPESDIDIALANKLNIDVVRRRSGGGAVWLPAGGVFWVDLIIPFGDPLWTNDVRTSMNWLGDVWVQALSHFGINELEVFSGSLEADDLGKKVCFLSRGPGEVFTKRGIKVVGISQRRTKLGARFQCAVYTKQHSEVFAQLLRQPNLDLTGIASVVPVSHGELIVELINSLNVSR